MRHLLPNNTGQRGKSGKQHLFSTWLLTGSLLTAAALSGFAQTPTGSIGGTVQDASGAAIPNAVVTIRNTATNITQTLKTDANGQYVLQLLLPGSYDVKVTATGFAPAEQRDVTVDVSAEHPADFSLKVGSASATVTVQATTPALQTSSASTQTVITGKQIRDLPLNGRNPFLLAELAPGVQNTGGASTPHISGSRNANNEILLDGITDITPENNVGNNSAAYQPIVDSVDEFSVITSVPAPEYGRFSGGLINLASRTGGNAFHGSLFEFNRDSIFDARDYFSSPTAPKPPLLRNQAGGTLGGPIIRDRTFFFFGYQISRETDSSTETDSVATQAERNGDFSALLPTTVIYNPRSTHFGTYTDPNGSVQTGYIRDPYPGNLIPAADMSAAGAAALSYEPLPNVSTNSPFNNYLITQGAPITNGYQYEIRVDHSWSQSWKTFVRFSHSQSTYIPFADYPANNGVASVGYNGPDTSGAYSLAYDNSFTLSPTLLLDLRYGLSRSTVVRTPIGGAFDITKVGLPASLAAVADYPAFPNYTLGNGYSSIGSSGYVPLVENPLVHDLLASFIKVHGRHNFKFGGEFRKLFLNFHQYGDPTGQYGFSQSWTQEVGSDGSSPGGNPIASLELGLPDYGYQTNNPTFAAASSYFALYAQDDWRLTNHVTINYGLRWDMDQPRTERRNLLSYWNPNDVSPINGMVAADADCPACGHLTGSMHFVNTASGQYGRQQINAHKLDFAPRIGVAWSPDPNWSVRAGFGIIFAGSDVQPAGTSGAAGTEGFSSQTNASFSFDNEATIATTLDNPYPDGYDLPLGAAAGPGTDLGNAISDSFLTNRNTRTPYTEQANLTVQRSLPGNTVVEVGYVYSQGLFLVDGDPGTPHDQVNPSYLALGSHLQDQVPNPFYGVITTPGSPMAQPTIQRKYLLRPFPQYNGVTEYRKDTAYSNYNSVVARVEKRLSDGLTVLASFTGAKLMDNSPAAVTYLGPYSSTYQNQYNPAGEYSVSPQDINHQLTAAYTYELPIGPGRHYLNNLHGPLSGLVTGYQTSGIFSFVGGTPLVVGGVSDNSNLFLVGQRPDMSRFNAKLSHPTRAEYFNTSLFSVPAPYTLGDAPRTLGNVRTPRFIGIDMSAIKNTYFGSTQRYNLQLRLEAFNALNHVQFAGPDTGAQNGTFGQINSTANTQRQVQLAAKFIF